MTGPDIGWAGEGKKYVPDEAWIQSHSPRPHGWNCYQDLGIGTEEGYKSIGNRQERKEQKGADTGFIFLETRVPRVCLKEKGVEQSRTAT